MKGMLTMKKLLALDPRPRYQDNPDRIYALTFAGRDIRFKVSEGILQVL